MTTPFATIEIIYHEVDRITLDDVSAHLDGAIRMTQVASRPFGRPLASLNRLRDVGAAIYTARPDFQVTPLRFITEGDTALVLAHVQPAARDGRRAVDQPMIERWRVVLTGRRVPTLLLRRRRSSGGRTAYSLFPKLIRIRRC